MPPVTTAPRRFAVVIARALVKPSCSVHLRGDTEHVVESSATSAGHRKALDHSIPSTPVENSRFSSKASPRPTVKHSHSHDEDRVRVVVREDENPLSVATSGREHALDRVHPELPGENASPILRSGSMHPASCEARRPGRPATEGAPHQDHSRNRMRTR
jgi:hypothetical protein